MKTFLNKILSLAEGVSKEFFNFLKSEERYYFFDKWCVEVFTPENSPICCARLLCLKNQETFKITAKSEVELVEKAQKIIMIINEEKKREKRPVGMTLY